MGRLLNGLMRSLRTFGRAKDGNIAMMTAAALPVLLMVSAGAIDLHNVTRVKSELQDAIDAASLAAARSPYTAQSDIQRVGMDSLRANMPGYFKDNPGDVANFKITGKEQVEATATVQVKTIVANLFFPPYGQLFDDYMPMTATSEVLRASRNVEVAMALDVTGSMDEGVDYMPDLRKAAEELVKIVIQGDQGVYTTKVALVPYAAGVNMGSQADAMRGKLVGPKEITSIRRAETRMRVSAVNNGTKEFTYSNHGLVNGDTVYLSGFNSNSGINGAIRTVTRVSNSVFKVSGTVNTLASGSGNNTSSSNRGYFSKCITSACEVVVAAKDHEVVVGEQYEISNTSGISNLNNYYDAVRVIDKDNFVIDTSRITYTSSYTSTSNSKGVLRCGYDGCATRRFVNSESNWRSLDGTTCVSERVRTNNQPSDRAPVEGSYLGRVYLNSPHNICPTVPVLPLTNDKAKLDAEIAKLRAGGSTAGHIGVENAWYAVSPNFGAINSVTPLAFDTQKTIKAVVLMTDGMFNTPFCQGVISKDATSGSGNASDKINCNAPNGSSFNQALATCRAMKAQGIVIYSVAFNLNSASSQATQVMRDCASTAEGFFEAKSGTDLTEAFKQIGRDITRLRIAR